MNTQLEKRIKALLWRSSMMVIAFLMVGFVDNILPLLEISSEIKVVIGLVFGEVSKYLNNR